MKFVNEYPSLADLFTRDLFQRHVIVQQILLSDGAETDLYKRFTDDCVGTASSRK